MNSKLIKLFAVIGVIASLTACGNGNSNLSSDKEFVSSTCEGEGAVKFKCNFEAALADAKSTGKPFAWNIYGKDAALLLAVIPTCNGNAHVERIVAPVTYEVIDNEVEVGRTTPTGVVLYERFTRSGSKVTKRIYRWEGTPNPEQEEVFHRNFDKPETVEIYRITDSEL
jgi:hypothetical protein